MTGSQTKILGRVADPRHSRGLIDTSVVIDLPVTSVLPAEIAISTLTLAELAAGTHTATDADDRAARQDRLQRIEATFDVLPFDAASARAYGRVFAAAAAAGRKARGRRALDLLIAATAVAEGLPIYTRNVDDFKGLEGVVEVVDVG